MEKKPVGSDAYIAVERVTTRTDKTCVLCGNKIKRGEKYLHMSRRRHLLVLCSKCVVLHTKQAIESSNYYSYESAVVEHCVFKFDKAPTRRGRTCVRCQIHINKGDQSMVLRKNRHLITLCVDCLTRYSSELIDYDESVLGDVVAEVI